MEDVRRADGRPDHQRGAGDASGRGVRVRAVSGRLEGDIGVWERLCTEGNSLSPAEGQTGKTQSEERQGYASTLQSSSQCKTHVTC